jgi:hypothetical protein
VSAREERVRGILLRLGSFVVWVAVLARPAAGAEVGWPPDPAVYEAPGTEVAPGLAVGDTIDQTNADRAEALLPPEVLAHYRAGAYRNRLVSWPRGIIHYAPSFEEATRTNAGRYRIDPETGTILEAATGARPQYVYGVPFPEIAADDPQGGIKALWNQFHTYWSQGSIHAESLLVWVKKGGVERESVQDARIQLYENQAPPYRIANPQDFSSQVISITKSPADLAGTVAMSYRYRDPKARDQMWTYIPALRRLRAVSPANRSDGFLGSDLSQDDGHFFDAKPEDFVWKTVVVREGLRVVDPASIAGTASPPRWLDGGGWRAEWPADVPAAGYMKAGWPGVAWAPVSGALAKRAMWIVEGVPRDRYYLYGRIELWIDAETWGGAFNRKFSWKGDLLNTYAVMGHVNQPARRDGAPETEWVSASQQNWQCAENVKMGRATLAGIRARPDAPLDLRVSHEVAQVFNLQALERLGK